MARRDTWEGGKIDPATVRLVVRCRGRRIVAVGHGEPASVKVIRLGSAWGIVLDGERLYDNGIGPGSGSIKKGPKSWPCPNHRDGHALDGAKLREVLERLGRPQRVASVEVERVVAG